MTVTLYSLVMLFGALVAGIGLVLLFRKHEQAQSRIKLFGQEFQFSAPGLVVSLAGCILFVLLPVLQVNDKDLFVIGQSSNDGARRDANVLVGGQEREPNDNFDKANIIKFGTTTQGVLTPKDRDFFKFQIPTTFGLPKVRVIVEKMFNAQARICDANEVSVASGYEVGEGPVSFSFESTPGAYYFVVVEGMGDYDRGEYTLILKHE